MKVFLPGGAGLCINLIGFHKSKNPEWELPVDKN